MADIKVVYFNIRGKGELIRLVLHAAGVDFNDDRVEFSDWPGMKPTTPSPTGQLPYIEYNGKVYSESQACARFLAKKYDLAGKNEEEIFSADSITCQLEDVRQIVYDYKHMNEEEQIKKAKEEFVSKKCPPAYERFEKMLAENGTGYFVGDSVTIADLNMVDVCDLVDNEIPDFVSKYPKITSLREKVTAIPTLAAYLKTRKQTDL